MATPESWREEVVFRVALTVFALSAVPVVAVLLQTMDVSLPPTIWLVVALWLLLGLSTAVRATAVEVRAVMLIALPSLALLQMQLMVGFTPNAGVAMAFGVVLAAVVFGARAAVAVTAFQAVATLAVGWMYIRSGGAGSARIVDPMHWLNWVRVVVTYVAFAAGLAVLVGLVVKRLEASLVGSQALVVELREQVESRDRAVVAQKFAETQLRQAQKMEAVGRIAGGVAHDFNNLLAIVQAGADRLEETSDPNEVQKIAKLLGEATGRAAKLTRSLLDFSNPGGHTAEEMKLNDFVEEALETIRRVLPSNIEVSTTLDPAINARDAMPDGGALSVLVDADSRPPEGNTLRQGSYVRLVVRDTGTGMTLDTMARIFDPFFTTKTPDHGSGLGLSQAYTIVEGCGGMIDVDSELGRGTRFQIWLPLTNTGR